MAHSRVHGTLGIRVLTRPGTAAGPSPDSLTARAQTLAPLVYAASESFLPLAWSRLASIAFQKGSKQWDASEARQRGRGTSLRGRKEALLDSSSSRGCQPTIERPMDARQAERRSQREARV